MEIYNTPIPELKLIEPQIYYDDRGYFLETYNDRGYKKVLGNESPLQDDHAFSIKNVLRGIHFQITNPQEQLLYLASGEIFFVAVDFRPDSPTFLQHYTMNLSAEKHLQIFMPRGVGSGYYTLTDHVNLIYKVSKLYGDNVEFGIMWNDPNLAIEWPTEKPIISKKDSNNNLIEEVEMSTYKNLVGLIN